MNEQEFVTKIETLDPLPSEAIVLYFNFDDIGLDEINSVLTVTQSKFPDNTIICLPDKVSLESWSKDELENYISMISEIIEEM